MHIEIMVMALKKPVFQHFNVSGRTKSLATLDAIAVGTVNVYILISRLNAGN